MSQLFTNEDNLIEKVLEIQKELEINDHFKDLVKKILDKEKIFLVVNNHDLIELLNLIFIKVAESLEIGDPWKNSVDPLTFFLGAAYSDSKSLKLFSKTEEIRQKEKSIGSKFGYFHQGLLRIAFKDARPLEEIFKNSGKEFDVLSKCGSIAIEVKSKWNTTKGDTRKDKYKDMWNKKKQADEIYFAEIVWKPKKNNAHEPPIDIKATDPLFFSDQNSVFLRCNGEYIYQRAAKYSDISCSDKKILKTIFENFPFILWLYANLYIIFFCPIEKINIQKKLDICTENAKRQISSESNVDRKKILELISKIGNEDSETDLFENTSRVLQAQKREAKDLIHQRNRIVGLEASLKIVIDRIKCFFNSESDTSFYNLELIGHLFEES